MADQQQSKDALELAMLDARRTMYNRHIEFTDAEIRVVTNQAALRTAIEELGDTDSNLVEFENQVREAKNQVTFARAMAEIAERDYLAALDRYIAHGTTLSELLTQFLTGIDIEMNTRTSPFTRLISGVFDLNNKKFDRRRDAAASDQMRG